MLNGMDKINDSDGRETWLLPKDMKTDEEFFRKLGFSFEKNGDDILQKVTLPIGWTAKKKNMFSTVLYDQKGRKRARAFYAKNWVVYEGNLALYRRYSVKEIFGSMEEIFRPFTVAVTDYDNSILFVAGQCMYKGSEEYDTLMGKAKNFLKENFPEWENPTKYWD